MKLNWIEFKNIGAYGNKIQRLEFSPEGGLWMVTGKNGFGKSTLVNLPKILYYGKIEKVKVGDIANRMNKHGYIRGSINVNPETEVIIERKFSPSNLIVEKNGEDIGKSGIANYQEFIDNEVTGLPYHIFSNIVSLSVNDFKSFVSMTPNDKRIIIDKLFTMEIINKMNELVKKDLKDIKINIDLYDREIKTFKTQIDRASKELDELKNKTQQDNQKRIADIEDILRQYIDKLKEAQGKLQQYTQKKIEVDKSYMVFIQQRLKLNHDLTHLETKSNLYDQDKCPTCETPFSEPRFNLIKEEINSLIQDIRGKLNVLEGQEAQFLNVKSTVQDGIQKLNTYINQINSNSSVLNNELSSLKVNNDSKEFLSIQNIINDGNIKLVEIETNKLKEDDKNQYLVILESLYSDGGIKKRIMESYLPTLNKEIEYTLNELHFPYTLQFTSDFEPELNYLGLEVNVETLSTGERKKVDLAVLISIIRMLKRKYPNLNIFMLDEVLSSIDGDGIYDIIGLLQKTAKELNMNIFIINHTNLPIEYFSYKIETSKNAGFSDMTISKLDDE